jgi:hypothetical protein
MASFRNAEQSTDSAYSLHGEERKRSTSTQWWAGVSLGQIAVDHAARKDSRPLFFIPHILCWVKNSSSSLAPERSFLPGGISL